MISKLTFNGTERDLQNFLSAFIRHQCTGQEHDAISASNRLLEMWGMRVHWHEFSYALDAEEKLGYATVTTPGGMTRYIIESHPREI